MGSFSILHLLIVLLVVVLIFGTSKLKNIGKDLGGAVKGFKDGMKDDDEVESTRAAPKRIAVKKPAARKPATKRPAVKKTVAKKPTAKT